VFFSGPNVGYGGLDVVFLESDVTPGAFDDEVWGELGDFFFAYG